MPRRTDDIRPEESAASVGAAFVTPTLAAFLQGKSAIEP
jgi:hypothetical protein